MTIEMNLQEIQAFFKKENDEIIAEYEKEQQVTPTEKKVLSPDVIKAYLKHQEELHSTANLLRRLKTFDGCPVDEKQNY
jgi:hypothetical protein